MAEIGNADSIEDYARQVVLSRLEAKSRRRPASAREPTLFNLLEA
jgi:hypothetical protein